MTAPRQAGRVLRAGQPTHLPDRLSMTRAERVQYIAEHRHDPVTVNPAGLEQVCPECGRWEAAGWSCSWCLLPMTSADWYRASKDAAERRQRLPTQAPANPPLEYRSNWPEIWGPKPRQRAVRRSYGGLEAEEANFARIAPLTPIHGTDTDSMSFGEAGTVAA